MLICFHSEQAEVIGVTGYQEPDRNTTALWWSHPTQCPLGLFCNDQHVWAHLPQHTSTPGYELCFVYPHIYTFGMTYYCWWLCSLSLGHFVCVFLAFIHSYTYNSIENKFLFSFVPATICSPSGTMIMANECFQAQSLIYLNRPKTQNMSLLLLRT